MCDTEVTTCALKCKLQRDFSQLIFLQQTQPDKTETVLRLRSCASFYGSLDENDIDVQTHSQDGTQHSGLEPEDETEMLHIPDEFEKCCIFSFCTPRTLMAVLYFSRCI